MRKIIHIDMDCFYAAIEMREHPELRGQPIAVGGHSERRGVLCTANYEARKYGVHSAMSSARAMRICPSLRILPVRFDLYRAVSARVSAIFREFTDSIQPLSLDEAFLDVTDSTHYQGSATRIAAAIRDRISSETQLTASAGVAPNKFLAKIASDWHKPDGQKVITPAEIADFVFALPVTHIWGVGKVTAQKLHRLSLHTCGDLQKWERNDLARRFGKFGDQLYDLSRGIDERPVTSGGMRKSFSIENTYPEDLEPEACDSALQKLHEQLLERLGSFLQARPEHAVKGLIVKLKFADFQSTTVCRIGSNLRFEVYRELLQDGLLRSSQPLRLLGCGVRFTEAVEEAQLDFFDLIEAPMD
ncbi:MAG: DNA polymerase-4 [Rhodothermales bacterium]|jgi:DNA polymerase-4